MSAKANSATDGEPAHGVTIAAEAYDANTPEQMLHGTEHILVDGEPLCGNHHVKKHVESGRYGTETTRHPLNGHDTCKSCGQIYVSRYGSKHEAFEQLADFEEGDWVSITTEDGETMTGRVSHTADRTDFPSRRITIVLSDEPQERWIYGVEQEIKVRVSEGEQPVIAHGSILDYDYSEEPISEIGTTTAPVDNVDERTAATLDDLEQIAGSRAKTVMTLGGDRHLFHINARESLTTQDLWELLDEFYKAGYEIKGVTPGEERSGTDCAAISLIAEPLKSPLATDGGQDVSESPTKRVMVDIETLGLEPGSAILSIGAVKFTKDGLGDEFYEEITLTSCQEAGLEIDADTLEWWLGQDDSVTGILTGGGRLEDVLGSFYGWFPNDGAEVWANSPSFDCEHLEVAFDAVGMTEPWEFRHERDVRTLRSLPCAAEVEMDGDEHDALDDAKYQARIVSKTLSRLDDKEKEATV